MCLRDRSFSLYIFFFVVKDDGRDMKQPQQRESSRETQRKLILVFSHSSIGLHDYDEKTNTWNKYIKKSWQYSI